MILNYLKIAWRNLERNKIYSFINITGLAIGLAVCMIIMLYVGHEYSYDRFHKNADRIVQIEGKESFGGDSFSVTSMSYAMGPMAKQSNPFVEDYLRIYTDNNNPIIQNPKSGSLKFVETHFTFADSNFFSFFSFKLSVGNKQQVLKKPFSVVISPKIANKYFGNENPIGKIIRYNTDYFFTVTGVAEKAPSNSDIKYDFVASLSSLSSIKETKEFTTSQQVQLGIFSTYFLLTHPQDANRLESSLSELGKNHETNSKDTTRYMAIPLVSKHFQINYADWSNTKYLKIFPIVAVLILLLAVINYISLSTARSTIRAKEIGVRKVMGADRKSVAIQFFTESALYTAIAFVFGYILCFTFQPIFFRFLQIDIDKSFLYSPVTILSFAVLFIVTVLFAASYPSLLLSAYKPVMVLYGRFSKQKRAVSVRNFFTVFQFSISIALIICGIVIDRQMYFFRHADTGVNRENIIMIHFAQSMGNRYSAFKKEAGSLASVQQTTTARYKMYGGFFDVYYAKPKNSNKTIPLTLLDVDENFIPMLGLKWKILPTDSQYYLKNNVAILNETAVEKMNFSKNPLNGSFLMGPEYKYVAGVVNDFNFQSMENKIDPLCILIMDNKDASSAWSVIGGSMFAKIKPYANVPALIQQLKNIYEKYDKVDPFAYYFMDDAFNAMYKAEDRLSKIFGVFTAFTLLIACLGLFGLSTFTAMQRTKEVGIRKVLGASVSQITTLLSGDFLKLVLTAIVIASPIAWLAMNKWLETFAYRIHVSWWMFGTAGTMAVLVALFTISFQAIKAAMANPVTSLRSE